MLRFTSMLRTRAIGITVRPSLVVTTLLLLLTTVIAPLTQPMPLSAEGDTTPDFGVATLSGNVTVTNPFLNEIITEPFVLLSDITNFVARDIDGALPDFVQITGQLDGDLAAATYTLPLPIAPRATVNDVDNGEAGDGLQIYAVDLAANLVGRSSSQRRAAVGRRRTPPSPPRSEPTKSQVAGSSFGPGTRISHSLRASVWTVSSLPKTTR
jgi:hypothetical protein